MSSSVVSSPRERDMTYDHVSLPDHLREALVALLDVHPLAPAAGDDGDDHNNDDSALLSTDSPLLSSDLSSRLAAFLVPTSQSIPHSLLLDISKHVRSNVPLLEARGLDPRSYEMLSLLAGVQTLSTATAEPPLESKASSMVLAKQWKDDRRALSAVLNAIVSVGGVGFAAWYAAGSAGWRDEWKALIALFAGLVVALSEGVLFVIWQDRLEKRRAREVGRRRRPPPPAPKADVEVASKHSVVLSSDLTEHRTPLASSLPESSIDFVLAPPALDEEGEQVLRRRRGAVAETDVEDM